MKTLVKTTLLLACSLILISGSCKKEKTGIDALPAPTTEGKNILGCLINGNAFVAQTYTFGVSAVQCEYGYIDADITKGHFFQLRGSNNKSDPGKTASIVILTNKIDIQEGVTYQFQEQKDGSVFAQYSKSSTGTSDTYSSLIGELKITKFDEANKIASGTFWFNAENDKGEKVEVKEGRFDARIL